MIIRHLVLAATAVAALTFTGCGDQGPTEPPTPVVQRDAVPGTGNPAIDEQLVVLNNQVVACATNGELDYQTASRIALLTSILRFTPSPDEKTMALLQAIELQLQHSQNKDNVSTQCFTQLNATIDGIMALL